jgi:predicted PurR-regulated permease PerM
MAVEVNDRQRRWLNALLILGTIAVALIVLGLVVELLAYFTDILLIFFLAWLLAFVLSPVVTAIDRATPRLPRVLAVGLTYGLVIVALSLLTVLIAQSLGNSIGAFVANVPFLQARLPEIVAPWQNWLNGFGLNVDLQLAGQQLLDRLREVGDDLIAPLSSVALASIGAFGNFLLIVVLSLYMVADRDRILAFFFRLVPPTRAEEARLFQRSVAASFGGFLRGQAIMGVLYGLVAAVPHLIFGLDYSAASATSAAVLMAIPFFGPFVAWAPPVLVAIFTQPEATLPTLLIMAVGWFAVMNLIQPRIMASAIGIHPIVVLGSVIVGFKIAGVVGAIFGIPIAAVVSTLFLHFLNRSSLQNRDVTSRAAKLVESREGRRVRIPTPPAIRARMGGQARPAEPPPATEPAEPAPDPGRP